MLFSLSKEYIHSLSGALRAGEAGRATRMFAACPPGIRPESGLLDRRNDEVLAILLPRQRHRLAWQGEILDRTFPLNAPQKLRPQRRHPYGRSAQFFAIHEGHDFVLPLPQQIPVEQQPKPIVCVPTGILGVQALCPVGGSLPGQVPERDLYLVRRTHPARDNTDAALKAVRSRVLQEPRHRGRRHGGNPHQL